MSTDPSPTTTPEAGPQADGPGLIDNAESFVRHLHHEGVNRHKGACLECDLPWPCPEQRLLDILDAERAEAARLRAALERVLIESEWVKKRNEWSAQGQTVGMQPTADRACQEIHFIARQALATTAAPPAAPERVGCGSPADAERMRREVATAPPAAPEPKRSGVYSPEYQHEVIGEYTLTMRDAAYPPAAEPEQDQGYGLRIPGSVKVCEWCGIQYVAPHWCSRAPKLPAAAVVLCPRCNLDMTGSADSCACTNAERADWTPPAAADGGDDE